MGWPFIIPVHPAPERSLGRDRGLFAVPADFDAPQPAKVLEDFGAVRALLDTQTWLWMQVSPERISDATLTLLRDPSHELLLSSASSWEIAIKYALGKLPLPVPPSEYVPDRMRSSGVIALAVTHTHALAVASLPSHHRDPFDRMLVAQARLEDLTIITADPIFTRYDVPV